MKLFNKISEKIISREFLINLGYLPRWIIFSIDVVLVLIANVITYWIISNLTLEYYNTITDLQRIAIILFTQSFFFFVFKTYAGIIRHSTLNDGYNILKSLLSGFIYLALMNYAHFYFEGAKLFLMPALILMFLLSFIFLLLFRIGVKIVYQILNDSIGSNLENIMIYGIDNQAIALANAINAESPKRYRLVGFIDKYNNKVEKKILDLPIVSHNKSIVKILEAFNAKNLIISDVNIPKKIQLLIVDQCLEHQIKLLTIPVVTDWNDTKKIAKNIKSFEILDLLNREPIQLENKELREVLYNKVVLITGAAGSIGSEISKQINELNIDKIILLDQAESPLHTLLLDLKETNKNKIIPIIADVRKKEEVEEIFKKYSPNIIYHAAAYKHVPLMEKNPEQAILTNVLGSKNIADLAVKYNVERFVLVSTDKAVNPSNIMGASKRIAEKYVQSLAVYLDSMHEKSTKFIVTRFGNVLGSNGSVVPLFTKQINEGGPVTITHPDIIRYFMTIPEACQLVLEASVMGNGGEVYIFDMGKPVKIIDLAKKMIQLAGYTPDKEIEIKIIGLRPGEKLYEELLNDLSKTLPTHHDKIMVAKDNVDGYIHLNNEIDELITLAEDKNTENLVLKMKSIVPEFKSMNSYFEALD